MQIEPAREGPAVRWDRAGPIWQNVCIVLPLQEMKSARHMVLLGLLLLLPVTAGAQGHVRRAMEKARERQEAMARTQVNSEQGRSAGGYLRMKVENGDTTYFDRLPAIYIFGRGKNSKNWREYYKLVWRFPRVYPYAIRAGELQHTVDSVIAVNHYGAIRKDRYISQVQAELFKNYEGALHQMTISQGALLLKLIDRETGQSSYSIIKEYKNGLAAGFWQGIAKFFDNDLKSRYDPEGEDRLTEELVQLWHAGEFRDLYWSVFWEEPPVVNAPKIDPPAK